MSSQLKEKQQQQQKDNKRDLEADDVFNQQLFRTLAYAGAGFGAGLVASVFLKHRKALTLLGAGTGAAYGATNFMNELNQFNKFKDYANQGKQSNTLKREDQLSTKNWDAFLPKQESLSQQKRYGGSGDDDDKKGGKSSSESKSRESKPNEKKGHEATETRPKTQSKSPSESQHTTATGSSKKENPSKPDNKKESDKNTEQSGSQKPSSPKVSSPSPKESNKSSQEQQKSQGKEQQKGDSQKNVSQSKEQQKGDSQKNVNQGKEQQKGKEPERRESNRPLSGSDVKGQGQNLQDFKTNPGAGKPAPGESTLYRGAERNTSSDKKIEELRDQQNRSEQDRWGKSKRTGNKMKVEPPPENIAGGQFSGQGLTAKSQVNAVIE